MGDEPVTIRDRDGNLRIFGTGEDGARQARDFRRQERLGDWGGGGFNYGLGGGDVMSGWMPNYRTDSEGNPDLMVGSSISSYFEHQLLAGFVGGPPRGYNSVDSYDFATTSDCFGGGVPRGYGAPRGYAPLDYSRASTRITNLDNSGLLGSDIFGRNPIHIEVAGDFNDGNVDDRMRAVLGAQAATPVRWATHRPPTGADGQPLRLFPASRAYIAGWGPEEPTPEILARYIADAVEEMTPSQARTWIPELRRMYGDDFATRGVLAALQDDNPQRAAQYGEYFTSPNWSPTTNPISNALGVYHAATTGAGSVQVTDAQVRAALDPIVSTMFVESGAAAVDITSLTGPARVTALLTGNTITGTGVTGGPLGQNLAGLSARMGLLTTPALTAADLSALGLGDSNRNQLDQNLTAIYLAADTAQRETFMTQARAAATGNAAALAELDQLRDMTQQAEAGVRQRLGAGASPSTSADGSSEALTAEQLATVRFSNAALQSAYDSRVRTYEQMQNIPVFGPFINMLMEAFGMGPQAYIRQQMDRDPNLTITASAEAEALLDSRFPTLAGRISVGSPTAEAEPDAPVADAAARTRAITAANATAETVVTDAARVEAALTAARITGVTGNTNIADDTARIAAVEAALNGQTIGGVQINLTTVTGQPDARLLALLELPEVRTFLVERNLATAAPAPETVAPTFTAIRINASETGHLANTNMTELATALGLTAAATEAQILERLAITAAAQGNRQIGGLTVAEIANGLTRSEYDTLMAGTTNDAVLLAAKNAFAAMPSTGAGSITVDATVTQEDVVAMSTKLREQARAAAPG